MSMPTCKIVQASNSADAQRDAGKPVVEQSKVQRLGHTFMVGRDNDCPFPSCISYQPVHEIFDETCADC